MDAGLDRSTEAQLLQRFGLRAVWLQLQLTGPQACLLTPRDREILTLVTLQPFGVLLPQLCATVRAALGTPTHATIRRIDHLENEGLLHRHLIDGQTLVDLPVADEHWMSRRLHALRTTPTPPTTHAQHPLNPPAEGAAR